MRQWTGWMRTALIILLLEIIATTSLINYTLLSQTKTVNIVQAQEVLPYEGTVAQAGVSQKSLDSTESTSTEIDVIGMIRGNFPDNAEVAIKLAHAESGLKADTESWIDKTADGHSFSIGLMQINLTQHNLGEVDCTKAFTGKNYKAVVINKDLYNKCVELAKDPEINLKKAKEIYDRSGWNAWGAYNKTMLN